MGVVFCPAGAESGALGASSVALAHHRACACATALECAGYRIESEPGARDFEVCRSKKREKGKLFFHLRGGLRGPMCFLSFFCFPFSGFKGEDLMGLISICLVCFLFSVFRGDVLRGPIPFSFFRFPFSIYRGEGLRGAISIFRFLFSGGRAAGARFLVPFPFSVFRGEGLGGLVFGFPFSASRG